MHLSGALVVFAKPPVPGRVKTRLIPRLGRRRATSLYCELLNKTLNITRQSGFANVQIWVDSDCSANYFNQLQRRYTVKLERQRGIDLGQRMQHTFQHLLRKYPYAIIIGSDCPSLTRADLCKAANYLEKENDIVLGPANDGGYYLIGLKHNFPELFHDIDWGKNSVFEETCNRIKALKRNVKFLEKRSDIDRPEDLLTYFKRQRNNLTCYP